MDRYAQVGRQSGRCNGCGPKHLALQAPLLNDGRTIGVVVTRLPDATQWPANVRVAVNASQVQFSKGHVLNDVRAALEIRAGA